jgi:hypothetical protein
MTFRQSPGSSGASEQHRKDCRYYDSPSLPPRCLHSIYEGGKRLSHPITNGA